MLRRTLSRASGPVARLLVRSFAVCITILLGTSLAARADQEPVDYVRQVKPLLRERCYACHGPLKQEGGLRLDTAESARRGGDSGAAIVAGDVERSLAFQAVTGAAGFRMPPEGEGAALEPDQVQLLKRWIQQGSSAPADERPAPDPRHYWSYQVPRRPPLPTVDAPWDAQPIDAFLQARREEQGLVPAAPAPPAVLLRRVYLDLVGLPPTRDELRQFLEDPSDAAYEQVVDQLLDRPQYGERWGRHWMDVWRYSDWYGSRGGNEIRYSQRHIWRWRDWIVESLNEDKPYDQMIREMLAGDEAAPGEPDVTRATGFVGRNWYKFDRNVWMFSTVEHTSQAFLALTMRCCRCHDHKYDPIAQEEYFRFRAFFEPHDVLTEPVPGATETVKDAKLGQVLKDGLSRVYDKQLDAKTYRFERGDDRYPDKSRELEPGVPSALGGEPIEIRPVRLPPRAFYPALRPEVAGALIAAARDNVARQDEAVAAAQSKRDTARQRLEAAEADAAEADAAEPDAAEAGKSEQVAEHAAEPVLAETFDAEAPSRWTVRSGQWQFGPGTLTESQVTSFATIVSQQEHPRNFHARVRYVTLQPGTYRSVGFSYDYRDDGRSSHDIYTSTGDNSQSVQAFHRKDGRQFYPPAGIVKTPIRLGEETTVEVEVRDRQLKLWLNGELKLQYVLPEPRADGKFALWVHQGAAEFREVTVRPLQTTLASLRLEALAAEHEVQRQLQQRRIVQAELDSLQARLEAERARYASGQDAPSQDAPVQDADAPGSEAGKVAPEALAASRAERAIPVQQAELERLEARQKLELLEASGASSTEAVEGAEEEAEEEVEDGAEDGAEASAPTRQEARQQARQAVVDAEAKWRAAKDAWEQAGGEYTAVGERYPRTSSGRRLALARWIASPKNPRTARVAVNHIWLRHFGSALVPTVSNFGLNGQEPSHPELLDWLAVDFVEHGWRMKRLHKQIVMSRTYRLSSAAGRGGQANSRLDGENRSLWRMNSRRMEAETVRDSVLFIGGDLDLTRGGPEIPETQGETVFRRSLYFRLTPNEKMSMLELFDVADPNACYRRKVSVVPQQALALSNSRLVLEQAGRLAMRLVERVDSQGAGEPGESDDELVQAAFESVLSRRPTGEEASACREFLESQTSLLQDQKRDAARRRAVENLVHVLLNHNDFVTIR